MPAGSLLPSLHGDDDHVDDRREMSTTSSKFYPSGVDFDAASVSHLPQHLGPDYAR